MIPPGSAEASITKFFVIESWPPVNAIVWPARLGSKVITVSPKAYAAWAFGGPSSDVTVTFSSRNYDCDGDGVNNCDDKCPASAPGEVVGPDGCPQEVVIDLRGVECPLNWAHARVALDEMSPGQCLVLLLDDPKALRDIPLAAEAAGYAPLDAVEAPGYWRLAIEV